MSKKNKKNIIPTPEKNKVTTQRSLLKSSYQKSEISFKIISATGLLISLLLLIFCYQYFGSFFEMNDDPRYVMAMKGFASPLPYNNFISVYRFTSDLYIFLYKHFPKTGWYGISMFVLLWGALFNIYIILYLLLRKRVNYFLVLALFIAFFFLAFFQNAYFINFTRPSILVTSSFIMLLTTLYLNTEIFKKNKWILVFPVFTYIFGHLTRLDAGYLGFACGAAFSLLFIYKQKPLLQFLLKFLLPVMTFILVIKATDLFSQKKSARNKDFLEKTELIRQIIDYRNAAAYVPKDAKDTMSYYAMINTRYCSDDKIISVDFLKKLKSETTILAEGSRKKFNDEFGAFLKSLKEQNSLPAKLNYSLLAIVILWFLIAPKNNYIDFLKYILWQLFLLLLIAGMSYFMKLPDRIFNPLLVIWTLGNINFIAIMLKFKNARFYYLFLLPCILIVISTPNYMKSNNDLIAYYKSYGEVNKMMVDNMNQTFNNTIFIPTNLRSWEMHNATDPINEINFKNGNSYVYLTIELSLAPETKDQLLAKFGTDDHSLLFKKISQMNNVVFISNDNFNEFLKAYYHFIYNQDYYFEPVSPNPPPFHSATNLNYYRLKSL